MGGLDGRDRTVAATYVADAKIVVTTALSSNSHFPTETQADFPLGSERINISIRAFPHARPALSASLVGAYPHYYTFMAPSPLEDEN